MLSKVNIEQFVEEIHLKEKQNDHNKQKLNETLTEPKESQQLSCAQRQYNNTNIIEIENMQKEEKIWKKHINNTTNIEEIKTNTNQ